MQKEVYLQLVGRMFYKSKLGLIGLWCCKIVVSWLISCLVVLANTKLGILMSPIITVEFSVFPFNLSVFASCILGLSCSVHVCF